MSCIRVIDQLTKAKLSEIAESLNINLPKTISKQDLKNIIISELNKNKVSRDKYIFPKVWENTKIWNISPDKCKLKCYKCAHYRTGTMYKYSPPFILMTMVPVC